MSQKDLILIRFLTTKEIGKNVVGFFSFSPTFLNIGDNNLFVKEYGKNYIIIISHSYVCILERKRWRIGTITRAAMTVFKMSPGRKMRNPAVNTEDGEIGL
jgi:hypothetical protein